MDPMEAEAEPVFKLTVPMSLWREMAKEVSPAFADSYLYGAKLSNGRLTPRTVTGYEKLRMPSLKGLFERLSVKLIKPVPFQDGGQLSVREIMPHMFSKKAQKAEK